MPIRLITPTLVASAKPRKKRYKIHDRDLTGFCLEVLPSGRKSYRVQSYCNGEDFFETIGDAGAMPLCEARAHVETRLAAFGNTKHDSNTPFEVVAEVSFYYRGRLWKPSTMISCRNALRLIKTNHTYGIEKNHKRKMNRFLSDKERALLLKTLDSIAETARPGQGRSGSAKTPLNF